MRSACLISAASFALLATPAAACTKLPAKSATRVAVKQGVVRVCVGGRSVRVVENARRAGAAGNRVAWISVRQRDQRRVVTVTVARVGREVRVLRQFVARRERLKGRLELGLVVTTAGDLAWSIGRYGEPGILALERPGKARRVLARYSVSDLALDDERTLRWSDGVEYEFFDLVRRACPSRTKFAEVVRTDQIVVTRALYGSAYESGIYVLRGCDTASGRDRVLGQQMTEFGLSGSAEVVGVDRTWALFYTSSTYDRDGGTITRLIARDVVSGRGRSAYITNGPRIAPVPSAAAGFAVADDSTTAWLADGVLYAMVGSDKIVQLDRGALAGLHAEGATIVWTRDGVRQSYRAPGA